MLRKTALLVAALLLFPVLASANSDLQASLSCIPATAPFGATIQWTATFTNAGNEPRPDVYMTASVGNDRCVDQRIAMLAGETRTYQCATRLNRSGPPYGVYASASIMAFDQLDVDPRNNQVSQLIQLESKADLRLFFAYNFPAYPALPFTVDVVYSNLAFTPAEDVQLTFDVPGAISVRALTEGCTASGTHVTCALGRLEMTNFSNPVPSIKVEVIAPDASASVFAGTAEIHSPSGDEVPANNSFTNSFRTYWTRFVTNTKDSGDGSLRVAIEAASASCPGECLVAFRIPNLTGVATIRPATPLPFLTGHDILVDGLTQARYVADTNPAGPEIELRGSDLTAGDGLVLATACRASVQGLAINGFPRHGLYATTGRPCTGGTFLGGRIIQQNYLGVDATGTTAVPNLRGIYADGVPASIGNNVISGNTRAGVFLVTPNSVVTGNTIGLDPTGTKPLGNGASGIYIGPVASGTDATRNHIAFNADAGVSIDAAAKYVNVYKNAIHANHQIAVDFGLDGPTPSLPIAAPDVTAAQYDAATNTTTISIATPPGANFTWIDVYANDAADPSGFGESQTYLGQASRSSQGLRFVYPGDLRGKWIAAQGVLQIITTFSHEPPVRSEAHGPYADTTSSEFGRAFQVLP